MDYKKLDVSQIDMIPRAYLMTLIKMEFVIGLILKTIALQLENQV